MKKLLYPIAFALTTFLILYSCSAEEEDTTPPPSVVKPTTPEPEPEPEVSQFTLTVTAAEGGTVSTEGGTYDEGTEVTITATPEEGYRFVSWQGNTSTSESLTITLNSNQTYTALFELIQYINVTILSGEGGKIVFSSENDNLSLEDNEFPSGSSFEVLAVPEEGYVFKGWEECSGCNWNYEENLCWWCDNPVQFNSINGPVFLKAVFFKTFNFEDLAPNYSYPNNTVGVIVQSHYRPEKNISNLTRELYVNIGDRALDSNRYAEWNSGVYFDFNNDGKLDYFSFVQYFGTNWAVDYGKSVLVEDIFGLNPNIISITDESEWRFGTNMRLIDFNNDGQYEIFVGFQNSHHVGDRSQDKDIPPRIYSFSQSGDITYRELTEIGRGTHDYAIGDVDNDGDVDIVYWEQSYNETPFMSMEKWEQDHFGRPILYLNDGNGNFNEFKAYGPFNDNPPENNYFVGFENYHIQLTGLTVDLFDINNDGILDLISGAGFSKNPTRFDYQELYFDYYGMRINYGMGNGKFDFTPENTTYLFDNSLDGTSKYYHPLGSAFWDFNSDGLTDIIVTGSPEYNNGFYITIFIQQGDGSFEDNTPAYVDYFEVDKTEYDNSEASDDENNVYWTSHPYGPMILDVDKDGDYDILVSRIGPHHSAGYANIQYWRNDNGYFVYTVE